MQYLWRETIGKLVSKILSILYAKLLLSVSIVSNKGFAKRQLFVKRKLHTSHGVIVFDFYKDRRKSSRAGRFVETYVIGMSVEGNFTENLRVLNEYVIVVTMYRPPFRNLRAITEMLLKLAIEEYINLAMKNSMNNMNPIPGSQLGNK